MICRTLFSITLLTFVINTPLYTMTWKERPATMETATGQLIEITIGNNHGINSELQQELQGVLSKRLRRDEKDQLPHISEENKDEINVWFLKQALEELKEQRRCFEEERQELETTRNELKRSNRIRWLAIGAGLCSTCISITWSLLFTLLRNHNSCDV